MRIKVESAYSKLNHYFKDWFWIYKVMPCLHKPLEMQKTLSCFNAIQNASCTHIKIVTGGRPDCVKLEEFKWVNTIIGNVKTSMHGAYHSINSKHLPRYLAEFCYRFNRRFNLKELLQRFMYIALRTPPMPYRLLKMAEAYG